MNAKTQATRWPATDPRHATRAARKRGEQAHYDRTQFQFPPSEGLPDSRIGWAIFYLPLVIAAGAILIARAWGVL